MFDVVCFCVCVRALLFCSWFLFVCLFVDVVLVLYRSNCLCVMCFCGRVYVLPVCVMACCCLRAVVVCLRCFRSVGDAVMGCARVFRACKVWLLYVCALWFKCCGSLCL